MGRGSLRRDKAACASWRPRAGACGGAPGGVARSLTRSPQAALAGGLLRLCRHHQRPQLGRSGGVKAPAPHGSGSGAGAEPGHQQSGGLTVPGEGGIGSGGIHWRTGTCGMTWSTRCAAVCDMRRAPHERLNPRRL